MLEFKPALSEIETALYLLLNALHTTQVSHQYRVPDSPEFRPISAGDERLRQLAEHYKQHLGEHPREGLALTDLWSELKANQQDLDYHGMTTIEPIRRSSEDLYFPQFAVTQRRVTERKSPHGWLPRSYFLAIPTSDLAFRCIVREVTGRCFCTTESLANCRVPDVDDFDEVRVSGVTFDFAAGASRPAIMHIYLPAKYGKWELIRTPFDPFDEKIVGSGKE